MAVSLLDTGDQVASIVGAAAGVLSLAATVVSMRRGPRPDAGKPAPGQRWLWLGVPAALVAVGVVAGRWVFGAAWPVGAVAALVAGLVALVALGLAMVVRGRAPMPLSEPLRTLLEHQRADAEQPWYDFGSLSPPGTRLIYVEQRTSAVEDGRDRAGRLFTVAQMLRSARHAAVSGGPGAGKSFMVAHIVLEAATWWLTARAWSRGRRAPYGPLVPVVVQARALVSADVPSALAASWAHIPEVNREFFTRPPLPRRSWLVLVDSLDEVVDAGGRAKVLRRLGAYLDSDGPRSRILVATRPLSVGELGDLSVRGVAAFQLRQFAPEDVRRFARRWFDVRSARRSDAEEEATRFLSRIVAAGLEPVVRVPLLCSMAALVYDADRDQELPTSRADLYAQFIALLRRGREGVQPEGAFAVWLSGRLDDLLTAMAVAQVRQDERRLMDVAADWVRDNAPDELAAAQVTWIGTVRSQLNASGLCTLHGADVAFVHHSVAEYLAADPRVNGWADAQIAVHLLDPTRRSLALFALARSGQAADLLVEQLLDGATGDPVAAGLIIADGIRVAPPLRRRAVETLLDALRTDEPHAPDCLTVLSALAAADDVRHQLEGVAATSEENPWVRATVADTLADLGFPAGSAVLHELATAAPAGRTVVGQWAAARLAARDGITRDSEPGAQPDPSDLAATGILGRRALRDTVDDPRAPIGARLTAATALYQLREVTGLQALRTWAVDPDVGTDIRFHAASALVRGGDRLGTEALTALAGPDSPGVPIALRRRAANALMAAGDPAGVRAMRWIATDPRLPRAERGLAVAALGEIGVLVDDRSGRRQRGAPAGISLGELADVIARRWSPEFATRGLDSAPMRAQWTQARQQPTKNRSRRQTRLLTTVPEIVSAFRSLRPGLLMIVGGPGSGKSTLALDMVLREIETRGANDPVPVLLSLSTWSAEHSVLDWAGRALLATYPALGDRGVDGNDVDDLVRSRRVLLVLDGLDELSADQRDTAIRQIVALVTVDSTPVVLTCRSREHWTELRRAQPDTLRRTAMVQLQPLSAADIAAALERDLTTTDGKRREPVLTEMRHNPNGPTARTLSSPQLLQLARLAYGNPGSDPVELLDPTRFSDRAAVERHLLDRVLPAAYSRDRAASATRWLAFLAALMTAQGTTTFTWWRLPLAVSYEIRKWLTGVVTALAVLPTGVVVFGNVSVGVAFSLLAGAVAKTGPIVRSPTTRASEAGADTFAGALRRERRRTWAVLAAVGTCCAVAIGLVTDNPTAAMPAGFLLALPSFFVTRWWGQWLLVRFWLSLRGHLPWQLVGFLRDAAERGVLRSTGQSYLFTYHAAQDHLDRLVSRPLRASIPDSR